jgi:hypothetical protein
MPGVTVSPYYMGLFRSVFLDLPCAHCGRLARLEAQFQTQGEDSQECYEVGQQVAKDKALRAGRRYPAMVSHYCDACLHRWQVQNAVARRDALLAWMEAGRLRLLAWKSGATIAIEALRELLDSDLAGLEARAPRPTFHLFGLGYDFVWDGAQVASWDDSGASFEANLERAIDQRLKELGWSQGNVWMRDDLVVWVDPRGAIQVIDRAA